MQVLVNNGEQSVFLNIAPHVLETLSQDNKDISFTINSNNAETFVTLILEYGRVGAEKIKAIKLLRELTGLGLTESKSFIENPCAPSFRCPSSKVGYAISSFENYGYHFLREVNRT